MTKTKNILKLENVSKIYRMDRVSVKALDSVCLAITEGEFVSIVGPSGSGKSTLMHIVGCLDTPTSGKVLLDDQEISQMTERQLAQVRNKKIGFVFQQFNLLPRTSALDNVILPLLYNGTPSYQVPKKATEVLRKVGLGERLDHHPNQLSGGQQQRVAIARALITDPSIILADEPTGNLDSKSGVEVMEIFKKLHQQGRTIVLVTHDDDIANKAQRIIRLKDGKVIN